MLAVIKKRPSSEGPFILKRFYVREIEHAIFIHLERSAISDFPVEDCSGAFTAVS